MNWWLVVVLKPVRWWQLTADVMCSDYHMNVTDISSDVISGPIGDQAVSAIWQLSLALVFKMIVTVFTFGIKVSYYVILV